mmetsp:Transcript_60436/g.70040  ORF Transcript_60436/g.70040 Transcript_60436/m.70040 type:complete len:96 (-) Transcript_60436:768-1055(-)
MRWEASERPQLLFSTALPLRFHRFGAHRCYRWIHRIGTCRFLRKSPPSHAGYSDLHGQIAYLIDIRRDCLPERLTRLKELHELILDAVNALLAEI